MKRYILAWLIFCFSIISAHDVVLLKLDHDTQKEIVLLEGNKILPENVCDTTKTHNFLHESLLFDGILINSIKILSLQKQSYCYTKKLSSKDIDSKIPKPPSIFI